MRLCLNGVQDIRYLQIEKWHSKLGVGRSIQLISDYFWTI